MNISNKKTPFQREWDNLCRKEQHFFNNRINKKESKLNNMLADKIPEKLQNTLDTAFEKAFAVIFDKGSGIIEKTFSKDKISLNYKVNMYTDKIAGSHKTLHAFTKQAVEKGNVNLAISGISGIGMGLFGIGIPDIPVFIGMIIKNLYEISLSYGIDYNFAEEKYFMLLIIKGAVSYGDNLIQTNRKIEKFIRENRLPENYSFSEQVSETSSMLSKELLYMKFLQGIPIIGVVGGTYDLICMKQITEYAKLKYQKRFLLDYKNK